MAIYSLPKTSTHPLIRRLSLHQHKERARNERLTALINNKNDSLAPIDPFSITCLVNNKHLYPHQRALAAKIRLKHLRGDSTYFRINSTTTPSPTCKLCNAGEETQGHILGACRAEIITALILKRHGTATTKLLETIKTSTKLGNSAIFADAEGGEHTARATDTITWYPAAPIIQNDAGGSQHSSLPDIIVFPKIDNKEILNNSFTPSPAQKDIILLDVTYTDDLNVKLETLRSVSSRSWITTTPTLPTYNR